MLLVVATMRFGSCHRTKANYASPKSSLKEFPSDYKYYQQSAIRTTFCVGVSMVVCLSYTYHLTEWSKGYYVFFFLKKVMTLVFYKLLFRTFKYRISHPNLVVPCFSITITARPYIESTLNTNGAMPSSSPWYIFLYRVHCNIIPSHCIWNFYIEMIIVVTRKESYLR